MSAVMSCFMGAMILFWVIVKAESFRRRIVAFFSPKQTTRSSVDDALKGLYDEKQP